MQNRLENLIIYRVDKDSLIMQIAEAVNYSENIDKQRSKCYAAVKELLDFATKYGWNHNLWQCLLTYHLLYDENSYTLSKERITDEFNGSIHQFLRHDMQLFYELFHYDFSEVEKSLKVDCFRIITDYRAIEKREEIVDDLTGTKIIEINQKLANAENGDEMLKIIDDFYGQYGCGKFAFHKAFRIHEGKHGLEIIPITNMAKITFHDLIGYESQKKELAKNTEAFLAGYQANNVLLYGESGTGKSTSIKAIANHYYEKGLRLIEIHKHQFYLLNELMQVLKSRNYGFIIYMDDLSFEENEIEYKYLKAVIEGGLEMKPKHVLIYATSNRRHLIRETWRDRNDVNENQDIHISETMSEKLSLVARFGISIYYGKPSNQEYQMIVAELAKAAHLTGYSEQELWQAATAWELRHGGVSGRCARQLIDHLKATPKNSL